MARKRLGELLLERGAVTQPQLDACLAAQKQTQQRLGVLLVQKGYLTEELLCSALSEALGIALVKLDQPPDWSAVHMLRPRFCEQNDLFPYGLDRRGERKQLLVAMADPLNTPAIQQIEFTTGLTVGVRLAALSEIRGAILRYYHKGQGEPGRPAAAVKPGVVRVVSAPVEEVGDIVLGEELPPEARKAALKDDLAFLFGTPVEAEAVEKLEKKFWALMRVLARKGLVTKEEFARELDESDG
ncbi:MAG: gspE3 [Myxococcaceae bacterium]|nr:gspE3 [Myxococcaceae bacterium]